MNSNGSGLSGGFLADLDEENRASLDEVGVRRRFQPRSTLFHEGDASTRVMILLSGRVKVSYVSGEGRTAVLSVLGAGELLGAPAAIDGETQTATVSCIEEVEVLVVASGDFREMCETNSRLAIAVTRTLCRLFRVTNRRRIEFATLDATRRLGSQLIDMAEQLGVETDEGIRITIPLTQAELADWVGASRESVGKSLQDLRSRRLITTEHRCLTVLDLPGLRNRVG